MFTHITLRIKRRNSLQAVLGTLRHVQRADRQDGLHDLLGGGYILEKREMGWGRGKNFILVSTISIAKCNIELSTLPVSPHHLSS